MLPLGGLGLLCHLFKKQPYVKKEIKFLLVTAYDGNAFPFGLCATKEKDNREGYG